MIKPEPLDKLIERLIEVDRYSAAYLLRHFDKTICSIVLRETCERETEAIEHKAE